MLDAIRKRKQHWVSVFIVVGVVIVMGFFGIGGMQDNNGQNGPAAWVNGEVISSRDFNQEYEFTINQYRSKLGGQFDEKLLAALNIKQRIMERLIQYRLLAQQAKKWGIQVTDQELADLIRSLPYFQKDGKFDEALYAKVPNRGYEETRQRENMAVTRLQTYLTSRMLLPNTEVERSQLLKATNVELEYAIIDFAAMAPAAKPSAKDIEEAKKNEAELKDYYDTHKADFTEKASAEIRQIRVGIPFQAQADVKAKAKAKADEISGLLTKENFQEIAKSKSDDEHAKKGGHLGWVARGSLEKPLEEAVDKLKDGEITGAIETPFGFYFLQLVGKKEAETQSFDSVKNDIAARVSIEKSKNRFIEEKKKAWDEVLTAGKPLDAELKKAKIDLKKTGAFSIGQGTIPGINDSSDAMVDSIFQLTKEKPVAPKLFFAQEKYYYLKLLSVKAAKAADLAKDAETFEKTLETSLQSSFFYAWAESLEKQAKIKFDKAFQTSTAPAPTAAEM